jgi:hypothetical protein
MPAIAPRGSGGGRSRGDPPRCSFGFHLVSAKGMVTTVTRRPHRHRRDNGRVSILVRSKAVFLNYRDKLNIEDKYLQPVSFPLLPGSDLAGEVVAVGSGVSRFKAGDQIVSIFRPKWLRGVPSREGLRDRVDENRRSCPRLWRMSTTSRNTPIASS